MLLDLCGQLSVVGESVTARLQLGAARAPDNCNGELGYPAYLLAEAFAQIACRAAQIIVPLDERRYLPAAMRALEIVTPLDGSLAVNQLMAIPLRTRPLLEFVCTLIGLDESVLARAMVVVAPAPLSHEVMEARL